MGASVNTGPLRGIVIHLIRREWLTSQWVGGQFVKVPYGAPWDSLSRTVGFNLWGRRAKIREEHGLSLTACLWCFREKDNRRYAFHPECKAMKDIFALGAHLPGPVLAVCAKCGTGDTCPVPDDRPAYSRTYSRHPGRGFDLDHRVAISIAVEVAGRDGWIRALMPGNLQWLCSDCHKSKTADDRRTLASLRRNRSYSPPPLPSQQRSLNL